MKQLNINGVPFYKITLDNSIIKGAVLSDVGSNFDSTFDTPVSSMTKDEFLNLYDDIFKDFQHELEATQFEVEKIHGWTYTFKTGMGMIDHINNPTVDGHSFTMIHFLKLSSANPQPHFIIGHEKCYIPNLAENNLIIFPSKILHGMADNDQDMPIVTFNINIALVE